MIGLFHLRGKKEPHSLSQRHVASTTYHLLDASRGFAALWVVMLHVSLLGLPQPIYEFSSFGLLGVQMFFVISGYCIANAALRSLVSARSCIWRAR